MSEFQRLVEDNHSKRPFHFVIQQVTDPYSTHWNIYLLNADDVQVVGFASIDRVPTHALAVELMPDARRQLRDELFE